MSEGTGAMIKTANVSPLDVTQGMRFLHEETVYVANGTETNVAGTHVAATHADTGEEFVITYPDGQMIALIVDGTNTNGPVLTRTPPALDLSQCTFNNEKGRRCKLPANHVESPEAKERKHRFVLRSEIKPPPSIKELMEAEETKDALKGFSLKAEAVPTNADVSRQYHGAEIDRSDPYQKKTDADAEAAYKKWIKAGSPKGTFEEVARKAGSRYLVPAPAFDAVIQLLRRSVQTGAPAAGKKVSYRRGTHENGLTIVNFVIVDQGTIVRDKNENK